MAVEKVSSWRQMLSVEDHGDVVYVEDVPLDSKFFGYLEGWLDGVERRYSDDVIKNIVSILTKSLREIAVHRVDDFVPYGDYNILDGITKQLKDEFRDPYFKPNPYMVVLYGPPGTGKTTWARQVAKKYLFEDGVMKGLYLEITVGDIASKWVGIPIQTVKSVLEAIKTDKYMSVLLIDEADAILIRPSRADSGFMIEQMQLVAEMKSQLSFVMNQNYPAMIILTTNYKDIIVNSDEALADRVIAWLEVPPPPVEVRERIVAKAISSSLTQILGTATPIGLLTAFRALWLNAPGFKVTEKAKQLGLDFRWILPALPWSADFLIGLLSVWGWNPLDKDLKLDINHREAIRVWNPDNPLLKVYARPIITLVELYRTYSEERGIPRSFLRVFSSLRRGIDDSTKLMIKVYIEAQELYEKLNDAIQKNDTKSAQRIFNELKAIGYTTRKYKTLEDELESLHEIFSDMPLENLGTHPLFPTILYMNLSKYTMSKEFSRMVDDIMSLISPIVYGIRQIFMPQIVLLPTSTIDSFNRISVLRSRLDVYNKIVVKELKEGKLLESLRVMYTDPDLDRAWRRALESIDRMQIEDHRIILRLPLITLRVVHPIIHANDVEEKSRILYELVKDTNRLEKLIEETVHELELEDCMEIITVLDAIDYYKRIKYPNSPPEFFLSSSSYPVAPSFEFFGYSLYVPRESVEEYVPALSRVRYRLIQQMESKNNTVTIP